VDYDDQGLAAMPKLVGGPKYSRPPVPVERAERPPDPDDLPLMSDWTPEDEELAAQLGLGTAATTAALAAANSGSAIAPTPTRRRLGGLLRGGNLRSKGR
jgi:hypothetical protein